MTGRSRPYGAAVVMVTALMGGLASAPTAHGTPTDLLRAAVQAARGTSCGPLESDPILERVAEVINESIDEWLNHTATHVPIEDPMPGLKELGYRGTKSVFIGGANPESPALAIKGAVLEGYASIPDCSYTAVGTSLILNETSGQNLAAVVLAGP